MNQPPDEAAPAANPTPVATSESVDEVVTSAPRFFFVAGSVALVVAALHYGEPVLMPLALAALLAFVLDPLVSKLRRIGVPMALAVTLVVCMTLALLGSLATLGAQQVAALSRDLPTYQTTIERKLRELRPEAGGNNLLSGVSRLMATVEREINAARAAIEPKAEAPSARTPTRVLVETAPTSPLRALADMLVPLLVPLATAGVVIVLLAYMLAQRREISDRLIRLVGGELHRMAEVLNDAARRVSRFLVAQVLINTGFGAMFTLGLWIIGVPAAPLWGAMAAVLRFVPYLGTLLTVSFPLLLAFAVDPGWSMVLWTALLIVMLEILVINFVEPIAYGESTGVSPVAVLLSAAFWVLVWGPMGLVLATPLTVCLAVLGRHLVPLRFLDVLLGTDPAFDKPTQFYRRLISGDTEEALALAGDDAERGSLREFYSQTGVPMLALAAASAERSASAKQRHRVLSGAARVVDELREDHAGIESAEPRVLCIGARSEFDNLSAQMLAHALAHGGAAVQSLPASELAADQINDLALDGVATVVLCSFNPSPQTHARFVCKRLRRRAPKLRIVLAAWSAPAHRFDADALAAVGADAVALTLEEAAFRAQPPSEGQLRASEAAAAPPAVAPSSAGELLERAAQHAAEVFRVPMATASWRDVDDVWHSGCTTNGPHARPAWLQGAPDEGTPWAAVIARAEVIAVHDLARVPEWASARSADAACARSADSASARSDANAVVETFIAFAGVPLHDGARAVRGVLALHDTQPREFSDDELQLLARIGRTLCDELAGLPPHTVREAEPSAPSYPASAARPAPLGAASA